MRKLILAFGIASLALAAPVAMAGGGHHHHRGGHNDLVPFAVGAVAGIVIGQTMGQPVYAAPPPPVVEYRYYQPPPRVIHRHYYERPRVYHHYHHNRDRYRY